MSEILACFDLVRDTWRLEISAERFLIVGTSEWDNLKCVGDFVWDSFHVDDKQNVMCVFSCF